MNGPESDDPSLKTKEEAAATTVELVGFGPSLRKEGAAPASVVDAAALAERRKKRRVLLFSFLGIIVLLAVITPFLYRTAKTWRAASLARTAEREAQSGQMTTAISTVKSAYMLAPNEQEVLRAMAMILSSLNNPRAMTYWNWVLESKSVTIQDRRRAAEGALKLGFDTQAGSIIAGLLKEEPQAAPDLLLAARYYSRNGAPSLALSFAAQATAADPAYQPAQIFLANEQLKNSYLHQTGVDALLKLADANDLYSFLAIERLAQEPNLKPEEIAHALTRLQAQAITTEPQRIAQLVLQLRKDPSQRSGLLDQAVTAHLHASTDDLLQFGGWLNANGESNRIFTLIPKGKALSNKDFFLLYVDALGDLKRWKELNDLLSAGPVPLEKADAELYLYRTSRELGDAEGADLHWRSAQVAAAHNAQESLFLASYAANLGDEDRAAAIYETLTQDLMAGRAAYVGLLHIDRAKDTRTVRDLLDEMNSRWPDDEAIANDDIYFNLLLQTRVPVMYQRAVTLAKADPRSTPHLTNVALAYLRLNGPAHALLVFENGGVDWRKAPPATRAVYAAALLANGREREAEDVAASLDRNGLRPEERTLIQTIP